MQDWSKLTILKRKGFLIPFFIFIFLVVIVYARDYTQDYNNALTRSIADAIYCKIGGACNGNLTINQNITNNNINFNGTNITGSGKSNNIAIWSNENHLTYNTSAIGGSGTGDNTSFNESMVRNIIINNNQTIIDYLIYVNSTAAVLDDYCNTDGKILKRVAGNWVCADDATGGAGSTGGNQTLYETPECGDIVCNTYIEGDSYG